MPGHRKMPELLANFEHTYIFETDDRQDAVKGVPQPFQ